MPSEPVDIESALRRIAWLCGSLEVNLYDADTEAISTVCEAYRRLKKNEEAALVMLASVINGAAKVQSLADTVTGRISQLDNIVCGLTAKRRLNLPRIDHSNDDLNLPHTY